MQKTRFLLALTGAGCLALAACPSPILQATVDNARDTTSPTIAIASPAEYSSYSRTLVVDGSVADLAGAAGTKGQVSSLSYEIVAHSAPKAASFDAAGQFHIVEPTDLKENIVIKITAVDWNGNQTQVLLPLTYAGNEIPSFISVEGNRQTVLSWDPVPGVVSYTLYIEPSALSPDPVTSTRIQGVTSPYTMKQLKNGSVYSFLLQGDTADARKNFSSVVRAIPLSTFDLAPQVATYFNFNEIAWRGYTGISGYEVFRATAPSGPYLSVSGPVTASPFRDYGVVQGLTYYYAVKPAANSAVLSEWDEAAPGSAPSRLDASLGSFAGAGSAVASAYSGGYLYIADYYYGLRVADIRQPSLPVPVSSLYMVQANSIVLSGSYAYLSYYRTQAPTGWALGIVDISNPAAPALAGSVAIPNAGGLQAEGVAVLGNLVFVAGFNDGFAVIDATNKTAPVVRLSNQGLATGISQNYSVVTQDRSGTKVLAVVGIGKTLLYTVTGTDSAPVLNLQSSTINYGRSAVFSGTTLYVSGTGGGWNLSAYATANLAAPSQLGSDLSPAVGVAGAEQVAVSGNRAYVSLRDYGYAVVDITNPAAMTLVQTFTVPGHPEGVTVAGGYLYVSAGTGYGVSIYGAGAAGTVALALTLANVNAGARLAVYRDTVYVSEFTSDWSVATYDVSVPASTVRTSYNAGAHSVYTPYAFAFTGSHALVAAERSGIMIWDSSLPASPDGGPPWYVSLPGGNAWSIALSGRYALVGTGNSYLDIVDLSYDNNLSLAGSVQTQGSASTLREAVGIAVRGDFAFVANEQAGLRVVDISNPEFPLALSGYGALPAAGSAAAAAVVQDCVLVADSTNGLLVYDASNPRAWSAGGTAQYWPSVPSGGGATDVAVRGNFAYVAKGANGIQVWDVTNPRAPVSAGAFSQAGFNPVRLVPYKDWLYAIDGASKLYVVNLKP